MRRSTIDVTAISAALMGLTGLAMVQRAEGVVVCGLNDELDFSGMEPLPFGGEILGIGPEGGIIVGASMRVTFTTTGTFDAANLGFAFHHVHANNGNGGAFGFVGSQVGWSGQGTFTTQISSSELNGEIYTAGQPFCTWFGEVINGNFAAGPIEGTFDELVVTIKYSECPSGDVNHDLNVGIADLLAVIGAWGACPLKEECPEDFNGDLVVGIADLLTVIGNWQSYCPLCT